jgi:hypothetical protein
MESAGAWIEHLPVGCINSWGFLRRTFIGNFQGTYVRPGNSLDLRNCRQKVGETLHEYIHHFSRQCTDLPDVKNANVISTVIAGTTNKSLVHELRHNRPRLM